MPGLFYTVICFSSYIHLMLPQSLWALTQCSYLRDDCYTNYSHYSCRHGDLHCRVPFSYAVTCVILLMIPFRDYHSSLLCHLRRSKVLNGTFVFRPCDIISFHIWTKLTPAKKLTKLPSQNKKLPYNIKRRFTNIFINFFANRK